MTRQITNIFGIQEQVPMCESKLWRTLYSSDGKYYKMHMPCKSNNRCDVCQQKRVRSLSAYIGTVKLLPIDQPVSFVTLTLDPKHIQSSDPETISRYGIKQFGQLRKNYLTAPNMPWVSLRIWLTYISLSYPHAHCWRSPIRYMPEGK